MEESFPNLEQPINDRQWRSVTTGIGDGVLDEGGNPYNLIAFNNVNNTVTLAVDTIHKYNHSILKGHYHKMDADMVLSVPPVSSVTTYYICLQYDPLRSETMPISVKVLTVLDYSSGKDYLELWRVERKPNQLLTDATVVKVRPTISPSIQVDRPSSLPEYKTQLFGTRARSLYTGEEFTRSFTRWRKISPYRIELNSVPGWSITSYTGGIACVPMDNGILYTWMFGATRLSDGYNISTDFGRAGNTIGSPIPSEALPDQNLYSTGMSTNNLLETRITTDGRLQIRSTSGLSFYLGKGVGFSGSFSWWTAESENYISR